MLVCLIFHKVISYYLIFLDHLKNVVFIVNGNEHLGHKQFVVIEISFSKTSDDQHVNVNQCSGDFDKESKNSK